MKYRVLEAIPERHWLEGDIVAISGKIHDTLKLEPVSDDTPHQHTLVVVDPASMKTVSQ